MKEKILKECKQLLKENEFNKHFEEEVLKLLDSGYIDYSDYNFKDNGYQLHKLILYCVFKAISRSYKPFWDTKFIKKYKSLIKNY